MQGNFDRYAMLSAVTNTTMSAASRAEARRKAILARGNDRLAKLTSSGRGDDPAYVHEGVSSVTRAHSTYY